MVWEKLSFEEFQESRHGGHLGYRNGTILAILNLYVAPMPPIKFRLNPTQFGRRCRLKNFKMVAMAAAILDIGTKKTISAILNFHVATMPLTTQSNSWFWRDVENVKRRTTDYVIS